MNRKSYQKKDTGQVPDKTTIKLLKEKFPADYKHRNEVWKWVIKEKSQDNIKLFGDHLIWTLIFFLKEKDVNSIIEFLENGKEFLEAMIEADKTNDNPIRLTNYGL